MRKLIWIVFLLLYISISVANSTKKGTVDLTKEYFKTKTKYNVELINAEIEKQLGENSIVEGEK